MTALVLDAEPACPGAAEALPDTTDRALGTLRAERRPFDDDRARGLGRTRGADAVGDAFSSWAFHRAWWDAYAANAHEETLAVVPADAPPGADPVAIVPAHAPPRGGALGRAHAHADAPRAGPRADPGRADGQGRLLRSLLPRRLRDDPRGSGRPAGRRRSRPPPTWRVRTPDEWDVVDLRRLRCADPAGDHLAAALGALEMANAWTLNVEREDVCPVVTFPEGVDIDGFLATLGKKERHEIRRKVRRAQAVGEIRLEDSTDPLADLEAFIDLHQKRWGDDGLFPATPGGEQSRVFIRRLFELFGPDGPLRLTFLSVGGRCIASGIHFETERLPAVLQRRRRPGRARPLAGRPDGPRLRRPRPRQRHAADGLPARQRVVQVRVGRGRRAHPAPARSTKGLT